MFHRRRFSIVLVFIFFAALIPGRSPGGQKAADPAEYLNDLKREMRKEWPKNRTVNLVFHGHSVPAGYFKPLHRVRTRTLLAS